MNIEQHIYYSCAAYSSIHPNRAAVLNHLFCVIGNGYEWENGELVEVCGDTTTKSGRRLSMKAAIAKVFRLRRKRNAQRAAWECKHKRDEKKALEHKKDCPIITRCNCGMFKIDPKNHASWCAKNFSPTDKDVLRCDCGATARIAEHKKFMDSIDATIEKCLAEMRKRSPESREAESKKAAAALKESNRRMRVEKRLEYRIPADIKKRVKDTTFDHWYPMCEYSRMVTFPDDIKPEWLEAVIETAALVIAHPPKIDKQNPVERQQKTVTIAEQCLVRACALKATR